MTDEFPFKLIVILVDEYPPAVAGGIASWAWALSKELTHRGRRVIVLAPRKLLRRAPRAQGPAEVRYIGWHDWSRYRWLYNALAVFPLCVRHSRLLVVGSTWEHLGGILRFIRWFDAKVVCFAHGTDAVRAITPPRRKRFERVLRRIDLFLPTSGFLDALVKKSFPGLGLITRVVWNGTDYRHFRPLSPEDKTALRKSAGISETATVIASAGRLIPAKGFDTLIRAVARACGAGVPLLLRIAGRRDGEYEKLAKLAEDLGIANAVEFAGTIPHCELPAFFNAADICALASVPVHQPYDIEDNLPMVLLEAGACGLPLIGTRCGGIPEIIEHGSNGFVVDPGDAAALSMQITRLSADPSLRRQMGEAARSRVEQHFTSGRMAGAFERCVIELAL